MLKHTILGIVNIIFSTLFIYLLIITTYDKQLSPFSFESLIHVYAPKVVFLFSLGVNVFLMYKLLIKNDKKLPFYFCVFLSLLTIFWALLFFIGHFFASNILFPIVSIALIIAIFSFLRKVSKKLAIIFSLITLLVTIIVIISSFEEDYCWKKGDEADLSGSKMVTATKEDAKNLKGFKVKEGMPIGASFKEHMLCHNTFNVIEALKEKYFFTK